MPLIRATFVAGQRESHWGLVDWVDGKAVVTASSSFEIKPGETPGQLLDRLLERYGRVSVAVMDQPEAM